MAHGASANTATQSQRCQSGVPAAVLRRRAAIGLRISSPPRAGVAPPGDNGGMPDLSGTPCAAPRPAYGADADWRLGTELGRLVGQHIGGRIAEDGAIDDPFCRQLARATDPVAQPAECVWTSPYGRGYTYDLADSGVRVVVRLTLAAGYGHAVVYWKHPDSSAPGGYRVVRACADDSGATRVTSEGDGEGSGGGLGPALAADAGLLISGVYAAWAARLEAVRAARSAVLDLYRRPGGGRVRVPAADDHNQPERQDRR